MTVHQPILTAVASGKGGTGKTFVASTLAQALANAGERVLLFDGDLGLSNVAVQLGLPHAERFPSVLAGTLAAHEAAVGFCRRPGKPGSVDVLAGPAGSGALAGVDAATTMRTVAALRLSVGYDRILLDLGGGIEDTVMRFAAAADQCLIVLTPDPASLTDAYAFTKLYIRRAGGRVPAFVVNQTTNAREAEQVAQALAASCMSFLNIVPANMGFIRRDTKVLDAVRHQTPLLKLHPNCHAAADVISLAHKITAAASRNGSHAASMR